MTFGLSYRRMRWVIAGWLTLSVILNVIDKQTLGLLYPVLREKFNLSPQQYSNIVAVFLVSYAVMYTGGGKFVDWIGERIGMSVCILWWSVCTMLTALAQGFLSLGIIRFLLGLGEPGNYPAALRATTRWFPAVERGLPVAVFSSGGAVGSFLAPPLIMWLTLRFGWRTAFVVPGALGLVWLVVWLAIYRAPSAYPGAAAADLEQFEESLSDGKASSTPWLSLLRNRKVLGLVLSRLVSDPVWQFCFFYIPAYLSTARGFSLADIGRYAWIPSVAGAIGGITGGRVSDVLIKRGFHPVRARSLVLYLSAALAPLGILTTWVHSSAMAIALMSVMAFVAYSWFITTAAMIPDLVSGKVVGSVLGFVGTAGSGGAALFSLLTGFLLSRYSYGPVFAIAGSLHVFGALLLWVLLREKTTSVREDVVCWGGQENL
jgi:ACS family hexuronate transporter-like MFS transporter